jgi:mRNA interferase MazF
MGMVMRQYDICLVNLEPAVGHEIKKIRPAVIISPDEMNRHIQTVIIAPMTTKSHEYPTRLPITFQDKDGWIVLDQIRIIDKARIIREIGSLDSKKIQKVKQIIAEMLVD